MSYKDYSLSKKNIYHLTDDEIEFYYGMYIKTLPRYTNVCHHDVYDSVTKIANNMYASHVAYHARRLGVQRL